jgi:hypothetical protein
MWTPPISDSAELTQWSLYINHDSEVISLLYIVETYEKSAWSLITEKLSFEESTI